MPVVAAGGALAGLGLSVVSCALFVAQHFLYGADLPTIGECLSPTLFDALLGAVIGLVLFPIAYVTVARAENPMALFPTLIIAPVVGGGLGWGANGLLQTFQERMMILNPIILRVFDTAHFILILSPVLAMFLACAWVAWRVKRRSLSSAAK